MAAPEEQPDGLSGRALGDFILREKVGEGGFGSVYRADQPRLEREAVVKVLRPRHGQSAEARRRFVREARLAGRFDHPFAAHIYDSDAEPDGTLWIAMELVRGVPLDKWLHERGPLPVERFAPFFHRICEVVQSAHERGIVHRDLKPANVMAVEQGGQLFPKLLDFGLARLQTNAAEPVAEAEPPLLIEPTGALPKGPITFGGGAAASEPAPAPWIEPVAAQASSPAITDERAQRTASIWNGSRLGAAMGTPAYLAPEAWDDGRAAGTAADLYALGILVWEALTARRPFSGDEAALRRAHREAPVPPLPPQLPAALGPFFAKALAKDPQARFASASAMSRALEEALAPVAAPASQPVASRWRARAAGALLGVAALVGVLALQAWRASLPGPVRSVHLDVAPSGEEWLTVAFANLARRELGRRALRFRLADEADSANVALRLEVQKVDQGVAVAAALGRTGGQLRALRGPRAPSVVEALSRQLDAVAALLDQGQPVRAPDAAERAEMEGLGAPSLAALHAYDRALSAGLGAVYNDDQLVARLAGELVSAYPGWPRAHVLESMARFEKTAEARAHLEAALQRADPGRDQAGRLMLRSLLATDTREAFRILAPAAAAHRGDALFQWMLGSKARGARDDEMAREAWRQSFELRPELQSGEDVLAVMSGTARAGEARKFVDGWTARAPDSEQAWLTSATLAAGEGRFAAVEADLRKLLLLHGEEPHRLVPICRLYLQIGRVDEAAHLASKLLRGSAVERNYGHFFLGVTEVLQGRLNSAEQSFRAAWVLGKEQGVVGNGNQSLEELRSLAAVLGDDEELERIDAERAAHFARLGLRELEVYARFEQSLDERRGGRCPDVRAALEEVPEGPGHASVRALLIRASAAAGCAPCSEAVRVGVNPTELVYRSLFQLGACAEAQGQLALAADAFQRVHWSRVSPTLFGATAYSVLARFRLGQVLEKQGHAAQARAAYQEFLSRWGRTDRPVPQVDEARAALARLR